MFGRGSILYHVSFQFKNGETGQKLLIVLNTPKKNQSYLCCKTTSQPKYPDTEGCHSERNFYVLNANTDSFPEKTWVQFHELYEFDVPGLLNAHFKDRVLEVKGQLREETIRAIVNCIRRSQDVSEYHLSLLD